MSETNPGSVGEGGGTAGGSRPFDQTQFRRVMGQFATGVSVVTTSSEEGKPHGLTVNAFMSVSLEPPLVLISIDKKAETHPLLLEARRFCVNILSEDQKSISDKFASKQADKFEGLSYRTGATGAPILDGAIAWIDCTVVETYEGGDHTLFLGEVKDLEARGGKPLLFYGGKYHRLPDGSEI